MRMSGWRIDLLLAGHDVVEQMRVHRRAHLIGARLHRRDESHQPATVVALRETLAVHQVSSQQLGIRVEEAVGGDQVDAGMVLPARQQRLQHAGGGRLADGHAARHADHERHRPVGVLLRLAEELGGRGEQSLARGHLEMDQPGQRQVDLFDLQEVQLLTEAAQALELTLGQLQRSRHTQRTPLTPVELDVRTRLARPRHAPSLAFTVEAWLTGWTQAPLIREYLLLGLRFDRVEEGYVDSFTGDPALRARGRRPSRRPIPPPSPARRSG